jgi:hypothetical protein
LRPSTAKAFMHPPFLDGRHSKRPARFQDRTLGSNAPRDLTI